MEFENYSGIANGIYNLKNGFKRYFREKFVVAVPTIAYTRSLGDGTDPITYSSVTKWLGYMAIFSCKKLLNNIFNLSR